MGNWGLVTSSTGDDKWLKKINNIVRKQTLLYKHKWNIRWAFTYKHDILTHENNMLSSHEKRSQLILWLHDQLHILQQKSFSLAFKWCLYSNLVHSWNIFEHLFKDKFCIYVWLSHLYYSIFTLITNTWLLSYLLSKIVKQAVHTRYLFF